MEGVSGGNNDKTKVGTAPWRWMPLLVQALLAGIGTFFGLTVITSGHRQEEHTREAEEHTREAGMSWYVKFGGGLLVAGALGGVFLVKEYQKSSRRRRLAKTRHSGHWSKQALADVSAVRAGASSTIRVLFDPQRLPSVTTSMAHLTLPQLTRTKPQACLDRTNAFHVLRGFGVALIEGVEVPISPKDTVIFKPGSSFYVANSSWNGGDMELIWVADPAAPRLQLKGTDLVERYDDGASALTSAARVMAKGVTVSYNMIARSVGNDAAAAEAEAETGTSTEGSL